MCRRAVPIATRQLWGPMSWQAPRSRLPSKRTCRSSASMMCGTQRSWAAGCAAAMACWPGRHQPGARVPGGPRQARRGYRHFLPVGTASDATRGQRSHPPAGRLGSHRGLRRYTRRVSCGLTTESFGERLGRADASPGSTLVALQCGTARRPACSCGKSAVAGDRRSPPQSRLPTVGRALAESGIEHSRLSCDVRCALIAEGPQVAELPAQ
jgi:hypothetical protein